MPPIFQPRANPISKAVIIGAVCFALVIAVAITAIVELPYVTAEGIVPKLTWFGVTPEQPVPFSHKHHAGDVGLDCRYCHSSAENSAFAGMPPTHTCMTCHSEFLDKDPMLAPVRKSLQTDTPIQWARVYNLPDYVYFDHSIHVAKGVGCETCHGRVDAMPLTHQSHAFTMEFCLGCHRNPAPHLRPHNAVFTMGWQPRKDPSKLSKQLLQAYHIDTTGLTDCYTCHR
jgi:hypothetical protein